MHSRRAAAERLTARPPGGAGETAGILTLFESSQKKERAGRRGLDRAEGAHGSAMKGAEDHR